MFRCACVTMILCALAVGQVPSPPVGDDSAAPHAVAGENASPDYILLLRRWNMSRGRLERSCVAIRSDGHLRLERTFRDLRNRQDGKLSAFEAELDASQRNALQALLSADALVSAKHVVVPEIGVPVAEMEVVSVLIKRAASVQRLSTTSMYGIYGTVTGRDKLIDTEGRKLLNPLLSWVGRTVDGRRLPASDNVQDTCLPPIGFLQELGGAKHP